MNVVGRGRGQLEREVMEVLWDHPDGMSAREVADRIDDPAPALTTVFTVLDRLRAKGLVRREGSRADGWVHRATSSRESGAVEAMVLSLTSVDDRHGALMRFVGELDDTDAAALAEALRRRER